MIKLTTLFDALGVNTSVIICNEKDEKIYTGKCGDCPMFVWGSAYVKNMEFAKLIDRYIVEVIYK